jgi:hypothetical protein
MRRIIGMSGVTAAVLLAGCGGSDFPTTPAVMQGTAVTDAGLTMTVTNTSQRKTIGSFYAWGTWGTWVVVKLHVSAGSDKPALFDPMFQQLFIDGREYAPNPSAAEAVDDKTGSAASLNPGSEADVVPAFAVSEDAPPFAKPPVQLVVRGDLNLPGTVVNLTSS